MCRARIDSELVSREVGCIRTKAPLKCTIAVWGEGGELFAAFVFIPQKSVLIVLSYTSHILRRSRWKLISRGKCPSTANAKI